jgi:hypothetical protein
VTIAFKLSTVDIGTTVDVEVTGDAGVSVGKGAVDEEASAIDLVAGINVAVVTVGTGAAVELQDKIMKSETTPAVQSEITVDFIWFSAIIGRDKKGLIALQRALYGLLKYIEGLSPFD